MADLRMERLSLYLLASEQQTTRWAQATYTKLPPELREIVHSYLWEPEENTPNSGQTSGWFLKDVKTLPYHSVTLGSLAPHVPTTETYFLPRVVGAAFAKEALHWLYENGCLGREIMAKNLFEFFTTPEPSTEIMPRNCKMRFLNVCATLRTKKLDFRTVLANKNLINGFTLNIRVFLQFDIAIFMVGFATLSSELQEIARTMRAKGSKVVITWELEQVKLFPTGLLLFPEPAPLHLHFDSQLAEEALGFSETQWAEFFENFQDRAGCRVI